MGILKLLDKWRGFATSLSGRVALEQISMLQKCKALIHIGKWGREIQRFLWMGKRARIKKTIMWFISLLVQLSFACLVGCRAV